MKVSAQIAWEFDRYSITRGYQIYEGKGIEVERAASGAVTSLVSGCHVVLRLKGTGLETGCNCQEFFKNRECRHIWAALLAAEEEGLFPAPSEGRVYLVKTGRPTPVTPETPLMFVPRAKPKAPPPPAPPAPRKVWLNRTTALVRSTSPHTAPHIEWPVTRVILYSIRVQQQADIDLYLSVLFADPKKNGKGLTKPRPFNLTYRQFDAIVGDGDRAILKTLAGARDTNSYYSSASVVSSWTLHPELARELLPRICATGRCFTETYGESDQPPLVWEDEPWHFRLAVERNKGQRFVIGSSEACSFSPSPRWRPSYPRCPPNGSIISAPTAPSPRQTPNGKISPAR
jgi:hypothetical protein